MRPPESFVGQPVRSLQTMLRVISEADSKIPTVVPDGVYGQSTLRAVSAFQRQYGLPVTGVTDQATWEKIVEAYDKALVQVGKAEPIEVIFNPGQIFCLGDESVYLYLLQSMLTVLSKECSAIDEPSHNGILDQATSDALAAYQTLAGLPDTGELDRHTWQCLSRHFTLLANHQSRAK